MKGGPTLEQRYFQEWVVQQGCILTDSPAKLHQFKDTSFNLKGCHKPWYWCVIPLCSYWLDEPENKYAIHNNERAFTRYWISSPLDLWVERVIKPYESEYGFKPMEDHVFSAITGIRK